MKKLSIALASLCFVCTLSFTGCGSEETKVIQDAPDRVESAEQKKGYEESMKAAAKAAKAGPQN